LEDAKTLMPLASVMGAAAGIYYISVLKPLSNYFMFVGLFALIGVGVGNVVLVVVYELYLWLARDKGDPENAQNRQTA
jgi:hypothetical protein